MGDYLQNIVLRSFSLANVVQPRVPQLFEQAPASEPLPDSVSQTGMTPVMRDPIAEVQTMQTASRDARRREAQGDELALSETSDRHHQLPYIARPAEPASAVQKDPLLATLTPPALDSRFAFQRDAAEPQPPSDHKEHKKSQAGPFRSEPSVAMIDRNPPALSSARLQSSIPKRTSPSLAQNLPAEQPTPVKITIGRVDVRAIMPSGPSRPSASVRPRPAMSLESYLKQREEGKR